MTENTAPIMDVVPMGDVASIEDATSTTLDLQTFGQGGGQMTTSVSGGTLAERMEVMSAINDSEKLKANIGKVIWLKDYVVQLIEMEEEGKPGTFNTVPRVTLINQDGEAFAAISASLAQGLDMLVAMAREVNPATGEIVREWNVEAIPVIVKEITTRRGFTAFNLVPAKKADIAREEAIAKAEAAAKK